MRGIVLPGFLLVLVTLVNIIIPFRGGLQALPVSLQGSKVEFGAYDPQGQLSAEADVSIDHIFLDWNASPLLTRKGVDLAARHKRALMVTLEPFPRLPQPSAALVSDVLGGAYDDALRAHCSVLGGASGTVYLRFAHEMDLANNRYPWSGLEPADYIAIYRHAVNLCRKVAPRIVSVWSPVGNAGLNRYYPGGDMVDFVGLSLFGLQPWEEITYGRSRQFSEALTEKYQLLSIYGKPVTIAEFGVCGGSRYRTQWLAEAIRQGAGEFPLLRSIIYFNDREPYRWPNLERPSEPTEACNAEYPDWRLMARSG